MITKQSVLCCSMVSVYHGFNEWSPYQSHLNPTFYGIFWAAHSSSAKHVIKELCLNVKNAQRKPMVIILDGNSDIGAHVRRNLCFLSRSRAVTNLIFFSERPIFLHACAPCFELPNENQSAVHILLSKHLFTRIRS